MKRPVTAEPLVVVGCDLLTQVPVEVVARIVCTTRETITQIGRKKELRVLFALRRVSRHFLRHLYDAYIVPQFRELSYALTRIVCDRSILLFPCLEKLSLGGGEQRLSGQAVTQLTRLRELRFTPGWQSVSGADVANMTNLRRLDMFFYGTPPHTYPCLSQLTRLCTLNIDGPSTCITELGPDVFGRSLAGLTALSVRYDRTDSPPRLCDAYLTHLTNLTSLCLWGETVVDVSGRAISLLTRLHSLDLSHVLLHDADLVNVTRLRRLRLPGNKHLTDVGLARLSALTWLDISECCAITDRGVSRLTDLKTLILRDTERHCRLTAHGLSGLHRLRILNLGANTNFTTDTLRRLTALRMLVVDPDNPLLGDAAVPHWKRVRGYNFYRIDSSDEGKCSVVVY